MKSRFALVAPLLMSLMLLMLLVLNVRTARSQSDRSVWDGVYTEEQAARGQAVFKTSCAACHTPVDFTGDTFLGTWDASTAQDLFSVLQKTMPMDNPGSLPPQNYADLIAYVFSANTFPAGKDELPIAAEQLKLIRIQQKK